MSHHHPAAGPSRAQPPQLDKIPLPPYHLHSTSIHPATNPAAASGSSSRMPLHTDELGAIGLPHFPPTTPQPLPPASMVSFGPGQEREEAKVDVIPTRAGRNLCVRHKQMASQDVNGRLQRSLDNLPKSDRGAITHLWSTFSNASHPQRKLILEGILTMCCFSQLSHLSDSLNEIIRIDPFSLLPPSVALRILGYLDAISLGRAAQVSRSWKKLADDDLLWRRMCGQHIERKCEKCGWGLPALERRRLKVELGQGSPAVAVRIGKHTHDHDHEHGHAGDGSEGEEGHAHGHEHGLEEVRREDVLGKRAGFDGLGRGSRGGIAAVEERPGLKSCDPGVPVGIGLNGGLKRSFGGGSSGLGSTSEDRRTKRVKVESHSSDSEGEGESGSIGPARQTDGKEEDGEGSGLLSREIRLTRPWKSVYCERLVVERNWRKGRCTTKTLSGHSNGVMCLQYHTSLSTSPSSVLITGSYDKTVRVWDLDTSACLRVLNGHTRVVRCLQFDQYLLFTGSMDGTVRMWNWRQGECLRVLDGHSDGVVGLNYNGYLLATASADSTVQVWNFRTGERMRLRGHDECVNAVVIWDGKTVPSERDPTEPPKWTVKAQRGSGGTGGDHGQGHGSFVASHATSTSISASGSSRNASTTIHSTDLSIEPGTMLFSASDDGTVKLWDLTTQACIRTFEGHMGQVQTLRVCMVDLSEEETRHWASKPRGRRMRGQAVTPPPTGDHPSGSLFQPASQLSPASAAAMVVAGEAAGDLQQARNGAGARTRAVLHSPPGGSSATLAPLDNVIADPTDPALASSDPVAVISSSAPDPGPSSTKTPVLLSGSLDGTVRLWDPLTGIERSTFFGHIEGVWAVDMDPLRIASASEDRTVKVWDRESGQCVQTLVGHRGAVTSLQLGDDQVVSGSDDGGVMVWNFGAGAGKA